MTNGQKVKQNKKKKPLDGNISQKDCSQTFTICFIVYKKKNVLGSIDLPFQRGVNFYFEKIKIIKLKLKTKILKFF